MIKLKINKIYDISNYITPVIYYHIHSDTGFSPRVVVITGSNDKKHWKIIWHPSAKIYDANPPNGWYHILSAASLPIPVYKFKFKYIKLVWGYFTWNGIGTPLVFHLGRGGWYQRNPQQFYAYLFDFKYTEKYAENIAKHILSSKKYRFNVYTGVRHGKLCILPPGIYRTINNKPEKIIYIDINLKASKHKLKTNKITVYNFIALESPSYMLPLKVYSPSASIKPGIFNSNLNILAKVNGKNMWIKKGVNLLTGEVIIDHWKFEVPSVIDKENTYFIIDNKKCYPGTYKVYEGSKIAFVITLNIDDINLNKIELEGEGMYVEIYDKLHNISMFSGFDKKLKGYIIVNRDMQLEVRVIGIYMVGGRLIKRVIDRYG